MGGNGAASSQGNLSQLQLSGIKDNFSDIYPLGTNVMKIYPLFI